MVTDEYLAKGPCRNRVYNTIMQHYLLKYYRGKKRAIELPYKLASVTHLTRITYLIAELKHFSLHRESSLHI